MSQTSHYLIPMNCSKMLVNNGDCRFRSLIPQANFIRHLNLTLFKHICTKHFKLPSMRSLSCINVLFVHINNTLFFLSRCYKLNKTNFNLTFLIIFAIKVIRYFELGHGVPSSGGVAVQAVNFLVLGSL